ncbi:sigma-70 family RNA polymerase sigma factor [Pseudomonas sp. MWU12-2323]|uniref:sigma-70 family RNA polymerase sigma factor n=1 Tax=Pseudomonas sp. MWU12-2323 TaxID=2651296 RepID=UPI0015B51AC2|nr:sigma-70 family RNA polymerase sigma factor [Pseudomonas sp. MWU12-2323]
MQTQSKMIKAAQSDGFVIPKQLAEFPIVPRKGVLLTMEQEQSFGYTVLQLTLDQIQAMACDRDVVESLLNEIEAAFTMSDKAEKAVSMVKVNGVWIRHGSIEDKEFTAYARTRIANARKCLDAMNALNAQERDLFYIYVLDALRDALSELLPYDMVLSKATKAFRERCSDLGAACRELVKFVAEQMHLTRPSAQQVCEQFWLSNKLPAICFGSSRYIQTIMPAKAKREFRFGVLERQQRIAKVALASGVPVNELLWSWAVFNKQYQRSDRLAGAFAMFNAGLAEKVAREYGFADDFDQVRSAAYQGLSRAISLYAPERGGKFSTYAVTWIRQTIIRDLIKQGIVRLPEGSYAMLGRVRAVYADLPHASDEYVCKEANITGFDLEGLRPFLLGTSAMSMDSLPNSDGEDTGLHAYIADENNDFVADLEEQNDSAYIVSLVSEALTEREFYVLTHRTGLGGAAVIPGAELADQLSISPQNISRMLKKAQEKLADVPELKEVWEAMPCV